MNELHDLNWSGMASSVPILVSTLSFCSCLLFSLLSLPSFLFILSIHSFFLPGPWAYLWLPRTLFKPTEKHSELKKKLPQLGRMCGLHLDQPRPRA